MGKGRQEVWEGRSLRAGAIKLGSLEVAGLDLIWASKKGQYVEKKKE